MEAWDWKIWLLNRYKDQEIGKVYVEHILITKENLDKKSRWRENSKGIIDHDNDILIIINDI
jgi:hypothetical protein